MSKMFVVLKIFKVRDVQVERAFKCSSGGEDMLASLMVQAVFTFFQSLTCPYSPSGFCQDV